MRRLILSKDLGSSPRVWGQDGGTKEEMARLRIIPTRVGTRKADIKKAVACEDHPHACGDKLRCSPLVSLSIGSSPRVWGQESSIITYSIDNRIIPTRVGTRCVYCVHHHSREDHPHACGDKFWHYFLHFGI